MAITGEIIAESVRATPSSFSGAVGEAACIFSLGSIFAFIVLYAFRSGSGDSAVALVGIMALSVLPVLVVTAVLSFSFAILESRNLVVAVAAIAAMLAPALAVYSLLLSILVMLGLASWSMVSIWRNRKRLHHVAIGPLVFKAGVVSALLVISTDASRIFIPEQMSLGLAQSDQLFHSAIAQMIAHYWRPTTGADGLSYQHYYFLSHAVAAGFSKLTYVSVPLVYVYWGAVALKLQLLWGIFIASLLLDDESGVAGTWMMSRLVFAWFVAVLTRSLESESFVFGMAIFLMLLPVLCGLVQKNNRTSALALLVALLGAFICAATKASIGFFVAVALLGAAWRLKKLRVVSLGIVVGLALLAIVTLCYLSPTNALLLDAGWHVLLASYLQYFDVVAILSFVLPLLLLLIAAGQPLVYNSRSADAIEWRIKIHVEPLMLQTSFLKRLMVWLLDTSSEPMFILGLSLVACVVVLFTVPMGSNIAYFSLVLLVMAAVIAPSILRQSLKFSIEGQIIRRVLVGFLAVIFGVITVQFVWNAKNTVGALYRSAFSAARNQSIGHLVVASVKAHHSLLGAVHEQILRTPWSQLTQDILSRSAKDPGLSVHTASAINEFWTRLSPGNPWWCIASHLMIPAELGIVQIRNIAPQSIETQCVSDGIEFYGYGKTQDMHRTALLSDEQLCAIARESKLRHIYIINSLHDLKLNVVLNCAEM